MERIWLHKSWAAYRQKRLYTSYLLTLLIENKEKINSSYFEFEKIISSVQWGSILGINVLICDLFFRHRIWTLPVITAQNTEIWLNFLVWTFCGKVQFPQNFGRITGECDQILSEEIFNGKLQFFCAVMRKLRLSTKCPHQEIRWNLAIFPSVCGR